MEGRQAEAFIKWELIRERRSNKQEALFWFIFARRWRQASCLEYKITACDILQLVTA